MDFAVVKLTANGNLLLKSKSGEPVLGRKTLFFEGKAVAEVFDTIASIEAPFYLAKPIAPVSADAAEKLVGKMLLDKKVK